MPFPLKHLLVFLLFLGLISACSHPSEPKSEAIGQQRWVGTIETGTASIPFRFELNDSSLILINRTEKIVLLPVKTNSDTVYYSIPHTEGRIAIIKTSSDILYGRWLNPQLPDQDFKFSAKPDPISHTHHSNAETQDQRYHVTFVSNDRADSSDAIGLLTFSEAGVYGTFITQTGDYRFMEGTRTSNNFWLSSFDGNNLYYATGTISGEKITAGTFYSKAYPPRYWFGQVSDEKILSDPDSLTTFMPDQELSFSARSFNGDTVVFDADNFSDKVTVISLFGSWCRNCHDELEMYRDLHQNINHSDFHVIPLAFEKHNDPVDAHKSVERVFSALKIPFTPYYGGKASKSAASAIFPSLGEIHAYPTTIIVDKKAQVRKVHSGFTGPGTGSYYENYRKEINLFITDLLAE